MRGDLKESEKTEKRKGWNEREGVCETHVCWTDSNAASLRDLTLSLKKITKNTAAATAVFLLTAVGEFLFRHFIPPAELLLQGSLVKLKSKVLIFGMWE